MADVGRGQARGGDHLVPAARAVIGCSPEERVLFATRDRWIEYPEATKIIATLSDLLGKARQLRPMGVSLIGRSDNGKSALLKRFAGLHPARTLDDGTTVQPVVHMQFPDDSQEYKFWSELLVALRIPQRVTDPPKVHKAQAKEVLKAIDARVLVLDEVHNLLEGSGKQQSHALVALKHLANDLSLHLVASGTEKAVAALNTDDQLSTRFRPAILPAWRLNDDLRTLLLGMERTLPLAEPSDLASGDMIRALEPKADQTIGGYVRLLQGATILAIKAGKERIDPALIAKVKSTTLKTIDAEDLKRL